MKTSEESLYHNELTFIIGTECYHHLAMATAPIDKSKELCNLIYQKLHYPERAYEVFDEVKSDEILNSCFQPEKKPKDPIKQLAFEVETLIIDCFKNKALEELPYYEKILESIDEEALAGGK